MKIEDQVVSFELARKLKELGVPQVESCFYWLVDDKPYIYFNQRKESMENIRRTCPKWAFDEFPVSLVKICAFTSSELGEMLPSTIPRKWLSISHDNGDGMAHLCFSKTVFGDFEIRYEYIYAGRIEDEIIINGAENEADSRAKCLIYLIENKLINI